MDTVCYNMDRHTENFGLLRDVKTGRIISLAPNYDNNIALIAKGYPTDVRREHDGLIGFLKTFIQSSEEAHEMYRQMKPPEITERMIDECMDEIPIKADRDYIRSFVLNGQEKVREINEENQMPVEECGNMIILIDAVCRREKNYSLANDNIRLLKLWSKYIEKYGEDPGNQLCTDDFSGHMPHNVNLSIKAVMGLIGFSDILRALGDTNEAERIEKVARKYADSACVRAKDNNGGYRLAFDRAGTFSLKYNAVWDKLWNSNVFTAEFYQTEIDKYKEKSLPYGIPLDSREKYTKSDWEI